MTSHSKSAHGKCKLAQVESFKKSELTKDESKSDTDKNNKEIKAKDLDHLGECMKKKLETVNRNRKLQILTFVPKSWSIRKAAKEFGLVCQKKNYSKNQKAKRRERNSCIP